MKHARGFTLVEILVDVVIIGLLAVGDVLAIGTSKRADELETEAQRRGLWHEAEEDDALRPRTLPPGMRIRLRIEGREVLLRPPKDKEPLQPQLMLFSNGDVTPFELTLGREGSPLQAVLASDEAGTVTLSLPGAEAKR